MDVLLQIGLILLALAILITIHELGHYWAARIFKMRVEVFSLFFGPKIFSLKRGETEWRLSIVPLGGYVKISGMLDESMDKEALKEEPKPYEFRAKPRWQRLIVMLGGIIMNIILGCILFIGIKWSNGDKVIPPASNEYGIEVVKGSMADTLGFKTGDKLIKYRGEEIKDLRSFLNPGFLIDGDKNFIVDRGGKEVEIKLPDDLMSTYDPVKRGGIFQMNGLAYVNVVDTNSVKLAYEAKVFSDVPSDSVKKVTMNAFNAGIKDGDQIIAIDTVPVGTFSEMRAILKGYKGQRVPITVKPAPRMDEEKAPAPKKILVAVSDKGTIGVSMDVSPMIKQVDYTFGEAIPVGIAYAFDRGFVQTFKGLYGMVTGRVNASSSMSGPLKISKFLRKGFQAEGWGYFWFLTAYLSMVLAIMNLLPIPVLDGGHVLFLLIESAIGRDLPDRFKEIAMNIGFFLIIGLMLFAIINDIVTY